jgi:hypothetical protein
MALLPFVDSAPEPTGSSGQRPPYFNIDWDIPLNPA